MKYTYTAWITTTENMTRDGKTCDIDIARNLVIADINDGDPSTETKYDTMVDIVKCWVRIDEADGGRYFVKDIETCLLDAGWNITGTFESTDAGFTVDVEKF